MNKELEPLKALETIRTICYQDEYERMMSHWDTDKYFKIVKNALKRLDKIETTTYSVLREDISNKLKAIEIIKSFNDYQIVEVQGKWYLMRGIEFGKSIKMPITKEQADLLKEVLL